LRVAFRIGGLLALLGFCLALLSLATPAIAADGTVTIMLRQGDSAETIRRAIDAAKAAGQDVTVRFESAPAGGGDARDHKAGNPLKGLQENFLAGVAAGNEHMRFVPGLGADLARRWSENRNGDGHALPGLLAVLGLAAAMGMGARALGRKLLIDPSRWTGPDLPTRFGWSLRVLGANLLALTVFLVVARAATNWLLPEADLARAIALNVVQGGMIGIAYLIAADTMLAATPSGQPLLALPRWTLHRTYLVSYALFGGFIVSVISLGLATASDPRSVSGLFAVLGLAITVLKVVWFWHGRSDFAALALSVSDDPATPGSVRRVIANAVGPLLILSAVAIWMIGRVAAVAPDGARWAAAAGETQIAVVLVPILAGGLVALLRARRLGKAGESAHAASPLSRATGVVLERGAGALVWAAGAVFLGRLWRDFLLDPSSADSLALLRSLVASALLLSAGWIVWVFLVAFFDAHRPTASGHGDGADEDAAQPVATRLGTVLPVLRGVVLGAVVGLTVLLLLARLGVDIAPLLAGFGILGLAISFGSQTLVRDIVSGIFFMAEDAFRVGEYIDTGRLKGTVEKISIRSVRLRHQSGQIHTVPFGQITAVTNASRDWATVKFNLRLDRDVDIEKARKAIKKVGIAMQEDPELSPDIIQPLKMQGIADIAENAIVVRLKLTAKPARASYLQREGTKRIYQALTEAGIPFASNAVVVRGGDREEGAAAASGRAAAQARQAAPAG
jgi:small-conductance mechanosensitive channel